MTHQTPEPDICRTLGIKHRCISQAPHNAAQLQTAWFDQESCSFTLQVQPKAADASYYGVVISISSEISVPRNCAKTAKTTLQRISATMRLWRHRLWYFCQSLCWQFQIHHNDSILMQAPPISIWPK